MFEDLFYETLIAMDRAYNDYKLYAQWTENDSYPDGLVLGRQPSLSLLLIESKPW